MNYVEKMYEKIQEFNTTNRVQLRALKTGIDKEVYKLVLGTPEQLSYNSYQCKLCEDKPYTCYKIVSSLCLTSGLMYDMGILMR